MSLPVAVDSYARIAVPHLDRLIDANRVVMESIVERLVSDVAAGRSLFIFGSGHSGLFPLEMYHRAGGASFVIPMVDPCLLPTAGPPVIRVLERTVGVALPIFRRADPRPGEMLWLASQSGINAAAIDVAIAAREKGMRTVAFTSRVHSAAVTSRHPSGKRLMEVCDDVVDLGGEVGDAAVSIADGLKAGPLSNLGCVFLGHSILVATCARLEAQGRHCTYTSVNTPPGEARNREIEALAAMRDPLLR
jgi:uncharacterized phosphosugar-binding protein